MKNNKPIEIYHARTIGSFFLLAFLAYGLGRNFFESDIDSKKYLGAVLIIANSVMVLFIGILFTIPLSIFIAVDSYKQMIGESK